jgi:5-carboxymethyl-2-hydroxymuconate isomerase
MPQIKLEYSASLSAGFDARAFAGAIHAIVVEIAGADLGSCKTRLVPLDDHVIGDGSADHTMIHVDLRILPGRTEDQKTRLGEAVLAAAVAAIDKPAHLQLQVTVEVRELDRAHYHKRVL